MIHVSEAILRRVTATYGTVFEATSRVPAAKLARDVLDEEKVHDQVELFCRTFGLTREDLRGKRLLEVGSGFGIFLAVLRRDYGVESYGIEPAADLFDATSQLAREILVEYGIDASISLNAKGEDLPFPDNHFDLIFSSNVLEHTEDPALVLAEAIRVLKPGGHLQFVYPNYGAFYEGHYAVPWIPYMNRALGKLWVRLWGRDPAFMGTLQLTNYFKTKGWLRAHHDVTVISYGEEIFRERMLGLKFKDWASLGKLRRWLEIGRRLHATRFLTWLFTCAKSFDPVVLSLLKKPPTPGEQPPDNRQIYEMRWSDWTDMKVYGPSSRWLRSLVSDQLKSIPPTSPPRRVLDLGCGEGSTTDFLALSLGAAEIVGVDRSATGIQCAQARFHRPNLVFRHLEETAGMPTGSFDLVTCFEVLEHVEDWRGMTREIARLSSRHLLVSFPSGRMRPFERNVGHLRNFRRGQFERYMASVGFEPVTVFYAGFPFFSPLFREACNLANSGGNSLTVGRYTWRQKRTSDVIYFLFRHLSLRRHGDQFCGLFVKRPTRVPANEGP